MSSGSMWHGLPMVRMEDIVLWGNRIKALESTVDSLESMLLMHFRGSKFKHTTCECTCHVSRGTEEELDGNSIYIQTVIDTATAPDLGSSE